MLRGRHEVDHPLLVRMHTTRAAQPETGFHEQWPCRQGFLHGHVALLLDFGFVEAKQFGDARVPGRGRRLGDRCRIPAVTIDHRNELDALGRAHGYLRSPGIKPMTTNCLQPFGPGRILGGHAQTAFSRDRNHALRRNLRAPSASGKGKSGCGGLGNEPASGDHGELCEGGFGMQRKIVLHPNAKSFHEAWPREGIPFAIFPPGVT